MLETKASYITAKEILKNAPVPQETRTYKPITHQQLIDLTLESIYQAGFQLDKETYSTAKDGNVANGRYTITNVADSEMQLQIGWQNSYDKSMSLKFAIGTQILVCSNGCVAGDYGSFKKKHNGEIQVFAPSAITEYIKQAGDTFRMIQRDRETMKNREITKRTAAEIVGRMFFEEEIIQSTQINIIKREMQSPTHNYNAPNSLWELYQYTTFAMKELHPSNWINDHTKAHNFFVNECGVIDNYEYNRGSYHPKTEIII